MTTLILPFILVLTINIFLSLMLLKVKKISLFISSISFLLLLGNFSYESFSNIELINNITVKNNGLLNYTFHVFLALLLLEIFYDFVLIKAEKLNTNIFIKSVISFLTPFIIGFSFALFNNKTITSSVAIGLIFSVTAIPILARFLHGSKLPTLIKTEIMTIAIFTDVFAWLFSLVFNSISIVDFFYTCILLFIFYFLVKKTSLLIILIAYFSLFTYLNITHSFSLILPLIVVFNKKEEVAKFLGLIKKYKLLDLILIPFIVFYATYNLNIFENIKQIDNYIFVISIIFLPIIVKLVTSLALFKKEKDKYFIAILLNTRGLTEIVFLNMFLSMSLLTNEEYLYFIIMTFISTLLPVIFKK